MDKLKSGTNYTWLNEDDISDEPMDCFLTLDDCMPGPIYITRLPRVDRETIFLSDKQFTKEDIAEIDLIINED